jgi:hypothetical protein
MLCRLTVSLLHIVVTHRRWHTLNSAFKSILILSTQLDLDIWIEDFSLDFPVNVKYTFLLPSCNVYIPSFSLCFDHLNSIRWSLNWLCDLLKSPIFLLFLKYKHFIEYIFSQRVSFHILLWDWEAKIQAYQNKK